MSSPLYYARFTEKKGAIVKVELRIVHPDVSDFGTDRLWAWKLLHEWVSPPDEGDGVGDDDVALASRYVKSVKLSPLTNGKVDKKASDFFTVKRAGKKDPTVVYTIEVTDAALLADINVGDGDEVYDYVEPGKGKKLTAAPPKASASAATKTTKAGAAKKGGKADEKALPAKTYDDIRRVALEGIKKCGGTWSDYIIANGMVQRWGRDASDKDVKGWLSYLSPTYVVAAAALVGLERLKAKKTDSAKDLLKLAESKYKAKDDYNLDALAALAPLWWRLGESKKADAALKTAIDTMKKNNTHNGGALDSAAIHTLLSMAARGGQWDEVMKLLPQSLKDGTYCDERLAPGAMAAWEGNKKVFDAIMNKWTETIGDSTSDKCSELSQELLRAFIARGEPEGYLELMLRYPRVIEDYDMAFYALARTEQKDPKLAVAIGKSLIENKVIHSDLHRQTLGIYYRHDPKLLEPHVKKDKKTWMTKGWGMAYLAAAGLTKDVRSVIATTTQVNAYSVAQSTSDRDLAVEVLKNDATNRDEVGARILLPLMDLGERAFVDSVLEKQLKGIEKQPTKNRDLSCRSFAAAAAQVGRPDLGFAAIKLPGPALRRYTAGDMVAGASKVGDFTTAFAALQLVPEGDANGRVSTAIQSGLRSADESFFNGPRAVPLSVNHETYVRGLIAANDRTSIEWMLSAYGGKLSATSQVEIDAFLEK